MSPRVFPVNDSAPTQGSVTDDQAESSALAQASGFVPVEGANQQRLRSMSLSLPWRRPKSAAFGQDNLHLHLSRHFNDLAVDDYEDANDQEHDSPHASASGHQHHSPGGSIKGMLRRASLSLKGIVHRRSSVIETTAYDQKAQPVTAHSTWTRLRQAAQPRNSRSIYDLNMAHDSGNMHDQSAHAAIPGFGDEPPVIPMHSGAAAKASAAMQNEWLAKNLTHWLTSGSDDCNDRESGIGISAAIPGLEGLTDDCETLTGEDANISRIDFVSKLPSELAIHILANLDAAALSKASEVSRTWNKVVKSQHIWRESCLRELSSTYATSHPVRPGQGLGIPPIQPANDWKQIYQANLELTHRWKAGKARPTYLSGHTDSIYCLQFDEHKIVTGSRDQTIRIWDMHTLKCDLIIGSPEVINEPSLLVNEDGKPVHYAMGTENQRAAESMPETVTFDQHHKASILCLQYDDEILVTGSSDSTCIVYDIKNGYKPIHRLRHHTAAVLDLAFDDKHIVTCSKDVSICVWDRQTGALIKQLRGHGGPVNAVQMRGNTIVSCSGDFRVKLWNIDTGKNIREFSGHTKGLACSQFSEDGHYVASAGNDKVIRIWDANTGECLREMYAHENLVRSLHIDSVSGRLISGSYDTDIKVWDMETGNQVLDFPRWHSSWVLSAKSDYRRIVSTGQDPKILIMDFGADVEGIDKLASNPPAPHVI